MVIRELGHSHFSRCLACWQYKLTFKKCQGLIRLSGGVLAHLLVNLGWYSPFVHYCKFSVNLAPVSQRQIPFLSSLQGWKIESFQQSFIAWEHWPLAIEFFVCTVQVLGALKTVDFLYLLGYLPCSKTSGMSFWCFFTIWGSMVLFLSWGTSTWNSPYELRWCSFCFRRAVLPCKLLFSLP